MFLQRRRAYRSQSRVPVGRTIGICNRAMSPRSSMSGVVRAEPVFAVGRTSTQMRRSRWIKAAFHEDNARPLRDSIRSSFALRTYSGLSTSLVTARSMNARARAGCELRLPKYTK